MGLEGVFRRNQIRKEIMLFTKIYKDLQRFSMCLLRTDINQLMLTAAKFR